MLPSINPIFDAHRSMKRPFDAIYFLLPSMRLSAQVKLAKIYELKFETSVLQEKLID
jgi:hypothetical protein